MQCRHLGWYLHNRTTKRRFDTRNICRRQVGDWRGADRIASGVIAVGGHPKGHPRRIPFVGVVLDVFDESRRQPQCHHQYPAGSGVEGTGMPHPFDTAEAADLSDHVV